MIHEMTRKPDSSPIRVVVAGGGLAGIAAATALASSPRFRVTLLESRGQLGGRATSYMDSTTQEVIDNCQHVSMGCCTNLQDLCDRLNIREKFQSEQCLWFVSPDGKQTPFSADPLPAPFHLTRSFFRLPYLSFSEKVRCAWAMRKLARTPADQLSGVAFDSWLRSQGQTENLIKNVWEVVLVSALSESLDRVDARYARQVFVEGFLGNSKGWTVEIPTVSLDELYSEQTRHRLQELGVQLQTGCRVAGLEMMGDLVQSVVVKDGSQWNAEHVVLAVPHHQAVSILPEHKLLTEWKQRIEQIESAPISSVHLWMDREVTSQPHAVFVSKLSQWFFFRGERQLNGQKSFLYQVVISASRQLKSMTSDQVIEQVIEELASVWPEFQQASLLHSRLITERRAVFSALPGIDDLRPAQQSPIANLQLAGDWTQTGWPSTMEGAVRSGYLAAENIMKKYDLAEEYLKPGLPNTLLSRLAFGLGKF